MKSTKKTSPQQVALEILAQIPGIQRQDMVKTRRDGTEYTLDALRLAQDAAIRLGACGTFPRGKINLQFAGGKTLSLGAQQCNSRLCPNCARRRGNRLAADMSGALALIDGWGWTADRIRFATLTIPNATNADAAIDQIMAAWHRTLATKTWGRLIAGGFRAVEVKPGKDGQWNVHLHAIMYLWTPGIPYPLLREVWNQAAGGNYNQRFDELRKKARAFPGETKAAAAARYLVKYLVKHEELKKTASMPGKLPHMLGALHGRRLFGAWGVGAAALRIERHERPRWTSQVNRHLEGYQMDGLPPERATLETAWTTYEIPVPLPPLPPAFRREDLPDQLEPKKTRWSVRKIHTPNPLTIHPWQELPSATQRTADAMRTMLEAWIANPKRRGPRPFRWRSWLKDAPKEWTSSAEALLGQQIRTAHLGAILWSRVQAPSEGYPDITRDEHIMHQLIEAHAQGIHTARAHLAHACTPAERIAYLARMPETIRHHLEERSSWQPEPLDSWQ